MHPLPTDLFARNLRAERERRRLSQAELARRIAEILGTNVDPSAVTRIEQQTRAVRLDEAVAAAAALEVPLMVLLDDSAGEQTEAQMQQYLLELADAQRAWEEARQHVLRLTRTIQALSIGEQAEPQLDPALREAIDARVPLSEQERRGTAPDA